MSENPEFEPHPQCTAKSLSTELMHHVLVIEKVFFYSIKQHLLVELIVWVNYGPLKNIQKYTLTISWWKLILL